MKTTELKFEDTVGYDEKVEIEIRLKQTMSSEDYKTIVDAANTILSYAGKYLSKPEKAAKNA